MRSIKFRLLSAIGAVVMSLSLVGSAAATWSKPNYGDLEGGLVSISGVLTKITTLLTLDAKKIKIVEVGDVLQDDADVVDLKNLISLKNVDILTLRNVLNLKYVLSGFSILTFEQFLNNNDVSLEDVVAVDIEFDKLIVFTCPCGADPYGSPCS